MRRLPTQETIAQAPRRSRADLRPTRGRIGLILAVGALPVALLAESAAGADAHLVFAVLWLAAVVSQVPLSRERWDMLAVAAVLVYWVSFLLPAGSSADGTAADGVQLLGYQRFGLPPVAPLPKLPPGDLVALVVGLSAWLANPLFLVALWFFRHREMTVALVAAAAAVAFGLMGLPAQEISPAEIAWLATPAMLAAAARWAHTTYW